LFGLNVALTEKFESNSEPMRIHVSEPCKNLLTPQYKTVERTDKPDLLAKVLMITKSLFIFTIYYDRSIISLLKLQPVI
jgi:hypothetical protein